MQQAKTADFKPFDAHDWRVGVAVSLFNGHITAALHDSLIKRAKDYGLKQIDTMSVAGAAELPLALKTMAASGRYQALVALGCVIRGETPHFDYVCKIATEGILKVELKSNIPIGFGLLTCNNEDQALERQNLGGDYLDAALQLASSIAEFSNGKDRT